MKALRTWKIIFRVYPWKRCWRVWEAHGQTWLPPSWSPCLSCEYGCDKHSLSSSECPSVHRGHITWKRGKMLLFGHSFIIDHFGEHLEVNVSQQTFVAKETQVTTVKSSQANILGSSWGSRVSGPHVHITTVQPKQVSSARFSFRSNLLSHLNKISSSH